MHVFNQRELGASVDAGTDRNACIFDGNERSSGSHCLHCSTSNPAIFVHPDDHRLSCRGISLWNGVRVIFLFTRAYDCQSSKLSYLWYVPGNPSPLLSNEKKTNQSLYPVDNRTDCRVKTVSCDEFSITQFVTYGAEKQFQFLCDEFVINEYSCGILLFFSWSVTTLSHMGQCSCFLFRIIYSHVYLAATFCHYQMERFFWILIWVKKNRQLKLTVFFIFQKFFYRTFPVNFCMGIISLNAFFNVTKIFPRQSF